MAADWFRGEVLVTIRCTTELSAYGDDSAKSRILDMSFDELTENGFTVESTEIEDIENLTDNAIFGNG